MRSKRREACTFVLSVLMGAALTTGCAERPGKKQEDTKAGDKAKVDAKAAKADPKPADDAKK